MNNIRKPHHTSQAPDFGNEITSRYDCRPGFQNIALHASHFARRRKKTTSRAQQCFIFFSPNDRISKNLYHYIWLNLGIDSIKINK
ncbi:hypothetical protein CEXT_688851 [Caerostris extrusa]|uniref:Uncharacterized protein n=1 Tax=Caerostris extrusa TaxID=172846 RepID=A0AAV4VQM8_CAEEX|nr:hypothetical protein CEXT_688851 [Caerostris extrusa]